jgi:hypothetical protein
MIKPVKQVAHSLQTQIEECIERAFLWNTPGLLVHSGGTLHIGAGAPFAAGMFVAEKDVIIDADKTVGLIVSLGGHVRAKTLLHNPYFSHASLYLPKDTPAEWPTLGWPAAGMRFEYGQQHDSKASVDVGPDVVHVTAQGWTDK